MARRAAAGSCVMRTMVWPLSCRLSNSASTSAAEARGRLVREQHAGARDDGARDGDALLLTAGKRVRQMLHAVAKTDREQRRPGARKAYRARNAADGERQRGIFERGQAGEQLKLLKNKADLGGAPGGERGGRKMGNIRAAEQVGACGQRVEQAKNVHEGGFSRAGCAGDRNVVAARDMEIDVAQCGDTAAVIYFTRRNEF